MLTGTPKRRGARRTKVIEELGPPTGDEDLLTTEELVALQGPMWNFDGQYAANGQALSPSYEGVTIHNSSKFFLMADADDWPPNGLVSGHPGWLTPRSGGLKVASSLQRIARDGGTTLSLFCLMRELTGDNYWLDKLVAALALLQPQVRTDWNPTRYTTSASRADKNHDRRCLVLYEARLTGGEEARVNSGRFWGNDTKRLEQGLFLGDLACAVYTLDKYSHVKPAYLSARNFWRTFLFDDLIHVLRNFNPQSADVPVSVMYPTGIREYWSQRSTPLNQYDFIAWRLLHEGYTVMYGQHFLYLLTGDNGYRIARDNTRDTIRRGTYLYGPTSWGFRAHSGIQLPKNAPGTTNKWIRRGSYINTEAIQLIRLALVEDYNPFGADVRGYARGIARYFLDVTPAQIATENYITAGDLFGGWNDTPGWADLSRSEVGQRWVGGANHVSETVPALLGARNTRGVQARYSTGLLEMLADDSESFSFRAHASKALTQGTDRAWFKSFYDALTAQQGNAQFATKPNHVPLGLRQFFRLRLSRKISGSTAPKPMGGASVGSLVFEDNFDGSSVDLTKWTLGFPYFEARHDPSLVAVENGMLRLKLAWNGGDYKAGLIHSKFQREYGFWEARARFPHPGVGLHTAFWLWAWQHWSANHPNGYWSEADVAEFFDQDPGMLYRVLHWGQGGATNNLHQTRVSGNWDNWHVHGFEWQPAWCRFWLNGVPTPQIPAGANMRHPMLMLFGTTFRDAGVHQVNTPWSKSLDVSHVRVWAPG